jgi:hypothetical protein
MDCDPGPNTYNLNALNSNDVFLSVLDSSGNFISALSIDGSHSGLGGGGVTLSVDMEKNLLLTGTYNNTVDFNPPFGAIITANGNLDVFIIKYSDINVGDSESPASNGITIYPNPGNEIFYIDFGAPVTGNLTVTNALGQCVMNEQLQDISRYELNLRSAAGIYFLNFYSNDRQTSFKIVQQ